MMVEAIALSAAAADAAEPGNDSWRVHSDVATYHEPIMNRNFFRPPNQAPQLHRQPDGRGDSWDVIRPSR